MSYFHLSKQGRAFWREREEVYKRMGGFLEELPEENTEDKFQLAVGVRRMRQMTILILSNEEEEQ